ncbi:MAG TPA: STAS domain-containing protein [Candidatus Kapabacteria bacterium]|nr:STAS domain-containing protein [Candidatus Kapabacteria bacterium]
MKIYKENTTLHCELSGRFDTNKALAFEAEINKYLDSDITNIVYDLKNIVFVSSYFLRVCLNSIKFIGKDNFKIINIHPEVKKVFIISGFDKIIQI